VLAAGRSLRMGGANKLLTQLDGIAIITRVVHNLRDCAKPILVVTGHDREEIMQALAGEAVSYVHNPDYETGLGSSLRSGLAALPPDIDAVLVCLGDMPQVNATHIARLIAAFDPAKGHAICVPFFRGQRGNPVLWAMRFVPEMMQVSGETGARDLLETHADVVYPVPMDDTAVLVDIDTPEDLAALRRSS
jgi:molybdenum cofactor cytidylyltransferase